MSLLIASSLLLLAPTPPSDVCAPIPGWEQVLADEQLRWIVIGEVHGSNEVPAIFADAVCLTARSRPVVVALEQPASDQAAINEFVASDGGQEAARAFLKARMWNGPNKDGRSSEAYFHLFETLRQMRSAGRISSVVAFQPSSFTSRPSPAEYEKAMADVLERAAQSGETVVVLVGNVHAMRGDVPQQPPYLAMAGNLPAEATATFNTRGEGGETWACHGTPGSRPDQIECGAHASGTATGRKRGVELNSTPEDPYSGVLYLGTPTSASPPQSVTPPLSN